MQGKIRRNWTALWIAEYQKRLSNQTPLEVIEWGSRAAAREEKFFSKLQPGDRLVALDEGGRTFDSAGLAEYIGSMIPNHRNLYLFVGEAYGHSEVVLRNVSETWSLSGLTMSYEVALVVLAEQLYRSMTIRTGHPYHK
ncbi:MAG: 23S rRNA (pseudouridine(1915)-N(3))-methyltransferase RlmH [Deferribacteraceae bacterium]|nr:23S rRNA (pseudouridine(1915)-N(3))-methyltransferase RlmH [Deferribacteraceae bacterium]